MPRKKDRPWQTQWVIETFGSLENGLGRSAVQNLDRMSEKKARRVIADYERARSAVEKSRRDTIDGMTALIARTRTYGPRGPAMADDLQRILDGYQNALEESAKLIKKGD